MYKPRYLHNWKFVELQSQEKLVWALNPKPLVYIWQAQAQIIRGCFKSRSLLTPALCDIWVFVLLFLFFKQVYSVPMHYFPSQLTSTHAFIAQINIYWLPCPLDSPETKVVRRHPDYVRSLPSLMEIDQQSNVEWKWSGHCRAQTSATWGVGFAC